MCMGKKIEEKTVSECSGKCSGTGQAKLSDSELEKQQQECHGVQKTIPEAVAARVAIFKR
jgi:hypothetical protein